MRGMFSYALMLVVNPILILFYQNCSMLPTPTSYDRPPIEARNPASPMDPAMADVSPAANPLQQRIPGACPHAVGHCAINVE